MQKYILFLVSLCLLADALILHPTSAAADDSGDVSVPNVVRWTPPVPGYKIMVSAPGIYQIDKSMLTAEGMPVTTLDPRTLRLYNAGHEVAIEVTGEADGRFDEQDAIFFYAKGVDTRYTSTDVFWLTYGDERGLRMSIASSNEVGATQTAYRSTTRLEENSIYVSAVPMQEGFDHWYGPAIQAAGADITGQRKFIFSLDQLATSSQQALLTGRIAGNVTGTHHLLVSVNGQPVDESSWQGRTLHTIDAAFPQSFLHDGDNVLQLTLLNDTADQPFDMVYVDWLQLQADRRPVAKDGQLVWDAPSGYGNVTLGGFENPAILLFDISNPSQVQRLQSFTVSPHYPEFSVASLQCLLPSATPQFMPLDSPALPGHYLMNVTINAAKPHRLLAVEESHIQTPQIITLDVPSHLQTPDEGADYILITHRNFWQQAKRLADYRSAQGLRVALVDVQDIYDEFNGGLMSAEAIHAFLSYAYNHWPKPAPRFVLLMGDGTYDMRHYLPDTADTFVPPYLVLADTMMGETAADNRYVLMDADILPDMSIGRMPVNTPEEAATMVTKTIDYETASAPGDWDRNILFVTDDPEGGAGDFYALSDELADGYADTATTSVKLLPPDYRPIKVYLGKTCDRDNPESADECRQQIVDNLNNSGALILNYIGHATKDYWAAERLLDKKALTKLHNFDKLTITLAMSCVDGYFHQPQKGAASFAEVNVRSPGGSVASWSSASLGLTNPHQYLEKGFFIALFHHHVTELGPAVDYAKYYLLQHAPRGSHFQEPVDAYTLFGDPALRIHALSH